ncbi:hypothetical protein CDL15_Pgr009668 [Punica granatum]|nr:hypothetical protein CDL15_Pgr009668 [Punica granatum]
MALFLATMAMSVAAQYGDSSGGGDGGNHTMTPGMVMAPSPNASALALPSTVFGVFALIASFFVFGKRA